MSDRLSVIGWTSSFLTDYPTVQFTDEHKKALVERIRKRKYNFTHESHMYIPYCAPFYSDNTLCVLTKMQWDCVMAEAYGDMPLGDRLMPMDIINRNPVNDVLFEKEKFEPKEGETNG